MIIGFLSGLFIGAVAQSGSDVTLCRSEREG